MKSLSFPTTPFHQRHGKASMGRYCEHVKTERSSLLGSEKTWSGIQTKRVDIRKSSTAAFTELVELAWQPGISSSVDSISIAKYPTVVFINISVLFFSCRLRDSYLLCCQGIRNNKWQRLFPETATAPGLGTTLTAA